MAYTIIRSDGTTLTTIQDGTINTTSTSLGLPGRNYAGYGQVLDTNFVRQLENYASASPPANPLRGQLWFNTNDNTLRVCPADGTTIASSWLVLASTSSGGSATFGNVTVTGNLTANNLAVTHQIIDDDLTTRLLTVTSSAGIQSANITTANINGLTTQVITTGGTGTAGTLTGTWTVNNTIQIANTAGGNSNAKMTTSGVYAANYYYANGAAFNPSGTYSNSNVATYLPTYTGTLQPSSVTTSAIAGGGTISGIWTLASGARINATYADLAERYAADAAYEVGTVVEIGGDAEITAVKDDASAEVFGVVSDTYAYLLNENAGSDDTHPAIALIGRIKIKVIGPVNKGQRLVSAGNGVARGANPGEATAFNTIGRALATKTSLDLGIIEAVVSVK